MDCLLLACDGACSGNGNPNAKGGWGVVARVFGEDHMFSGSKKPTTNNEMELMGFVVALEYVREYLDKMGAIAPSRNSTSEGQLSFEELLDLPMAGRTSQEVENVGGGSIASEVCDFDCQRMAENVSPISSVILYCDSAYIVDCIREGWYLKWERNGWRTSSKEPVKNKALWEQLLAEYREVRQSAQARSVSFEIRKIKGHISGKEAEKWLAKYNARYGFSMSAEDFSVAMALNDIADKLAVQAGK